MNLAAVAIEKKAVTYFGVVLLVLAGIASFFSLGQLEDPEYTVKTALIVTPYPGASPTEVELEVTDRIELALQELKPLDYVESYSSAGLSVIKVEIQAEYWADALPQIWDELRRKIRDVGPALPPGERYFGYENPKGELGFYVKTDGTGRPARLRMRAPSFVNLAIIPYVFDGVLVSDTVAILGSLDFVMGECDR